MDIVLTSLITAGAIVLVLIIINVFLFWYSLQANKKIAINSNGKEIS